MQHSRSSPTSSSVGLDEADAIPSAVLCVFRGSGGQAATTTRRPFRTSGRGDKEHTNNIIIDSDNTKNIQTVCHHLHYKRG